MSDSIELMDDDKLLEAHQNLVKIREVVERIENQRDPWADEHIANLASEIAKRGLKNS